ncbi:GL14036 [Drosophila persimilis]|uniref:GL14036 n=1 Tax=Drosophila persimilis TaxID=7234 RepID=B4GNJ9_DROPE|nr:GL14036 [Drosophila persimilis]
MASTAGTTLTTVVKRPGPPVPPRPKTATATAAAAAAGSPVTAPANSTPPIIQKKPTFVSQLSAVGRTLVYKSPALSVQKKQAQTQTPTSAVAKVSPAAAPTPATKPLKLRKAPDVPTAKPRDRDRERASISPAVVVTVNRHKSMSVGTASAHTTPLKDTRLSLGKVDFERAGLGLQATSQPLPRPRKIVQLPVATLDVEDVPAFVPPPSSTPAPSIFRRSKTTLDTFQTATTASNSGGFLGGRTVEIKNNLKNAAERLFSEIIINQSQKQSVADTTIITKHERAIQHQATNCMRINVNGNYDKILVNSRSNTNTVKSSISVGNTPEKKQAFHELLISELAAMRNKSCSLEQLPTKSLSLGPVGTPTPTPTTTSTPRKVISRHRYNSIDDADDAEDVDADNVEDADSDGDEEHTLTTYSANKLGKENAEIEAEGSSSGRKRCPSGCSSDSSPYGTERSQRIRTSDWIEVGDNGTQVTLTSCHISLEDSGMEDEERLDDMSSSGVGDSWDSVKEAESEKRSRSVKRGISISALPPLPKSLIGFNKLLGSDSGLLLSDGEAVEAPPAAPERLNNNNNNNNTTATLEIITPSNVCANGNTTVTTTSASPPASAAKTKATTTVSPAKESPHLNASTLDDQIATLRKEMNGLRQLDLSLLSQLWVLNESIQEFRAMIEEQENEDEDEEEGMGLGANDLDVQRHSPTPSSYESVSSEGGGDVASDVVLSATKAKCLGTIPKVITTQPKIIRELISQQHQEQQPDAKQKPVPRMRSAPPPPPHSALALATSTSTSSIAATTERKPTAPSRPT